MAYDFELQTGYAPILISLPHDGTEIPATLRPRMTQAALHTPDTDWHVGRLYAPIAQALGASLLRPRWSRYVVDLNRPCDGAALYPGQRETGLVPLITFAEQPIYREGQQPSADECHQRVVDHWHPYHQALRAELERLRALHGQVLLWEGHSIRSRVPLFFSGTLPDFNLGTADGQTAASALQERLVRVLSQQSRFSHAVNGRFKGGYITRHYAAPDRGIQAVQLELAQKNYMDEDTFAYDAPRATGVQALIQELLACF